jgi:hypothetical protein
MDTQASVPGNLHSQNVHPFAALFVISTAAADGELKRFPKTRSEPDSTRPT